MLFGWWRLKEIIAQAIKNFRQCHRVLKPTKIDSQRSVMNGMAFKNGFKY